jgi:hypothetical protein
MKRTSLALIIILLAIMLIVIPQRGWPEELYSIFVNGAKLDVKPLVKDGIVYLPVEVLASQLQLSFEWNTGLNSIKINDRLVSALPYTNGGVVYLPVESIAQAINAKVKWDGKNKCVQIDIPKNQSSQQIPLREKTDVTGGSSIAENAAQGSIPPSGNPSPSNVGMPSQSPSPDAQVMRAIQAAQSRPSVQADAAIHNQPMIQNPPAVQGGLPIATTSPPGTARKEPSTGPSSKIDRMKGNVDSAIQSTSQIPLPYNQRVQAAQPTSGDPPGMKDYRYPSSSAYPGEKRQETGDDPFIRPMNAPPAMPDGLKLPPGGPNFPGNVPQPQSPSAVMAASGYSNSAGFLPKQGRNEIFSVTVSNIEDVGTIKNYYRPHAGAKYVVVYLSQQNVSDRVQIYTGKFTLADGNNMIYEYQESLSNYWLVILKPGGMNFGYLVFEMPENAIPTKLILHALNSEPLAVNL